MLFNSFQYLLLFLPLTCLLYFYFGERGQARSSLVLLVIASLVFYSYWDIRYLPLILGSMLFNFCVGFLLMKKTLTMEFDQTRWLILAAGVGANLMLLGYFKYTGFFIDNLSWVTGEQFDIGKIVLPLGISFFTFTQIAYLVDAYRGEVKETSLLNYALFVTFFPHLLAGPIIHHKEMMPQFKTAENTRRNWDNIFDGMVLICIGLFKKAVIADYLAIRVNHLYGLEQYSFWAGWAASLAYTMQLYFDFSGYTDIALGSARLFNIVLPINFNSPYRASTIQDFWRRWHITLSRFLKEYLYIPFGGNRGGEGSMHRNLMATFILGGLWHGAGWTFIIWGALHGLANSVQKFWSRRVGALPKWAAVLLTFGFVNVAWVFFRAKSVTQAWHILHAMFLWHGVAPLEKGNAFIIFISLLLLLACWVVPNSQQLLARITKRKSFADLVQVGIPAAMAIAKMLVLPASVFIYFQF